jgi:hypothetical protein
LELENREDFRTWHEMFDLLCQRAGYSGNAELASRYCSRIGKTGRDDFEAVQKNLRNWRLGRHLPLRRNLVLLADLLRVQEDRELLRRWNTLYTAARGEMPQADLVADASGEATATAVPPSASPSHLRRLAPWAALALGIAVGGGLAWSAFDEHRQFKRLPMIGYDARVKMVVGETRLIHGDRGDCGGEPPDWYYILPQVPPSALGIFSDGGIARKMDNGCNAVVRARAVRFTARTAGSEELKLLGDYMKIVVTDRGHPRTE